MMSKLNFHVVQNSVEKRERENMLALGKPRRRQRRRDGEGGAASTGAGLLECLQLLCRFEFLSVKMGRGYKILFTV